MPVELVRPLPDLTEAQRAAVLAPPGPLLVLAGAGSGKTRVLAARIAHRLAAGTAQPERTLAITFTTRAAKELTDRLTAVLGPAATAVTTGTFHAVCHRLLRIHAPLVGRTSSFSIYDDADRRRALRTVAPQAGSELREYERVIGRAKARLWTPGRLATAARDPHQHAIAMAWGAYERLLADADALDFDDLLVSAVRLLADHDHVREQCRRRWPFVVVDEYQDVNPAQARWLELLGGPAGDLTAAGDDDQAVYGFRSAAVRYILGFADAHPGARVVTLGENHRCSGAIVAAARTLVEHNDARHPKPLRSALAPGMAVHLFAASTAEAEATGAAGWVRDALARGVAPEEVAVLFRTRSQGGPLSEALTLARIAHRVTGGQGLLDRAEVKDALAYLILAVNPRDRLAFARAVQTPRRGLGPAAVAKLVEDSARLDGDLVRACFCASGLLREAQSVAAEGFARTIREIANRRNDPDVGNTVIAALQTSGLLAGLNAGRKRALRELVRLARAHAQDTDEPTLGGWLAQLRLDHSEDAGGEGRVTLATVHAAKGLEWRAVLICGMEEGMFPHARAAQDDLDEERRLAYVALTRAREQLALSWAAHRNGRPQLASRFIAEAGLDRLRRAA